MGSPISPLLANAFVHVAIENNHRFVHPNMRFFRRFVDDTFLLWEGNIESFGDFMSVLNGIHDNIKFTFEVETSSQINFLDINIMKHLDPQTNEGSFHTKLYMKPHAVINPIPWFSHHTYSQKLGSFVGFIWRIFYLNTHVKVFWSQALDIVHAFHLKQYPISDLFGCLYNFIHRIHPLLWRYAHIAPHHVTTCSLISDLHLRASISPTVSKCCPYPYDITITLPFLPHISNSIVSLWRKHIVTLDNPPKVSFILTPPGIGITSDLTMSPIDKMEKSNIIYFVNCEDCNNELIYIGETSRALNIRMKEHISNYNRQSVVGEHKRILVHNRLLFNPVYSVDKIYQRRLLEKMCIDKYNPSRNTKTECHCYLNMHLNHILNLFKFVNK
jgi:hypothetical protein